MNERHQIFSLTLTASLHNVLSERTKGNLNNKTALSCSCIDMHEVISPADSFLVLEYICIAIFLSIKAYITFKLYSF